MATIHRAKSLLIYLTAILVSGLFSFIGRSSPTWAQEAKSERSAQVFEQVFRAPEINHSSNLAERQVASPGSLSDRAWIVAPRSMHEQIKFDVSGLSQEQLNLLNNHLSQTLQGIYDKIKNDPNSLTPGELALWITNLNAVMISNQQSQ